MKCSYCKKIIPEGSTERLPWGCDFDSVCNQKCYDAYRKEMDHFCSVTLKDDKKFANWLGVPEYWITGEKQESKKQIKPNNKWRKIWEKIWI
jgi:hypothetical protein